MGIGAALGAGGGRRDARECVAAGGALVVLESRQAAVAATFAKLQSCAPKDEGEHDVKLSVVSVVRHPEETSVRLAAYALDKPVEFNLPVYLLSRGRWLINEKGRVYLLDEQCREYKLKDRRSSVGTNSSAIQAPPDGRIKLEAGQVFEATLSFPRLPDEVQMGVDRKSVV